MAARIRRLPKGTTPEKVSDAFVRVGFEVEGFTVTGQDIKGPILIGKVKAIQEVTEFKKPIRYVELDCNEKKSRFVICGATNFAQGDLVVVALPGSVLPGGFAISARETYGKTSNGMICSTKELGLSEESDGILTLAKGAAKIGENAFDVLELNDVIFDIAVNPDRGYALSIRGLAREIAGAFNVKYSDPAFHSKNAKLRAKATAGTIIKAKISDSKDAEVMYLRTLANFDPTAQSPLWLRRRIEKCGMRSISLAVDVTNYVMLELGQPLHAFDAGKISGTLKVSRATKATKFVTLDGQERTVTAADLLISDNKKILALAGTMGGLDSEVTDSTTALAIEAIRFNAVAIAKNARNHKLSTEASRRFERGVDPELAEIASLRAVSLLAELGGATYVGVSSAGKVPAKRTILLDPLYPSKILGYEITNATVAKQLKGIGCGVVSVGKKLKVTVPSWRPDLEAAIDLVEEVARTIGFDSIPSLLPPRPASTGLTQTQARQRKVATLLADLGLYEVQTYPFVSEATMKVFNYTGERAATYRIANPMADDAPLLRTHLIPGLVQAAERNLGRGARGFGLFEIGSIFRKTIPESAAPVISTAIPPSEALIKKLYAGVPPQHQHVGGVLVGAAESESWHGKGRDYDWSDAISFALKIIESAGLTATIVRSDFAPWHPERCAELQVNGKAVAHAGEIHPRIIAAHGLPARSSAFVVNLSALPETGVIRARAITAMPVAVQDLALVVDSSVAAGDVMASLQEGAGELLESIELFDRYDQLRRGKDFARLYFEISSFRSHPHYSRGVCPT
jgi:phenylalanyl-tRNA synthetase beta chain